MADLHNIGIYRRLSELERRIEKGGGGGDNGSMEKRMSTVEQAISRIEATLPHLASKSDMEKGLHTVTWRLAGVCATLVAAVYFIARYVH